MGFGNVMGVTFTKACYQRTQGDVWSEGPVPDPGPDRRRLDAGVPDKHPTSPALCPSATHQHHLRPTRLILPSELVFAGISKNKPTLPFLGVTAAPNPTHHHLP